MSEAPALGDQYINQRAELWFRCKDWLERRDCKLADDQILKVELATPKYKFTSSGKRQVESKDEIKRRGVPSPDIADALILTFASDAVVAGNSTSYLTNWRKPLRRNIPRVA